MKCCIRFKGLRQLNKNKISCVTNTPRCIEIRGCIEIHAIIYHFTLGLPFKSSKRPAIYLYIIIFLLDFYAQEVISSTYIKKNYFCIYTIIIVSVALTDGLVAANGTLTIAIYQDVFSCDKHRVIQCCHFSGVLEYVHTLSST